MRKLLLFSFILLAGLCTQAQTSFAPEALNDTLLTLEGKEITFGNILKKYRGKTVVIDVWASWCKDCVEGMPKVKALQGKYVKDVVYLFLSMDKTDDAWKKGIEKFAVAGEHYFLRSGWQGGLGKSVTLDWIPRYMVVDKKGAISLFKAIEADDEKIVQVLK